MMIKIFTMFFLYFFSYFAIAVENFDFDFANEDPPDMSKHIIVAKCPFPVKYGEIMGYMEYKNKDGSFDGNFLWPDIVGDGENSYLFYFFPGGYSFLNQPSELYCYKKIPGEKGFDKYEPDAKIKIPDNTHACVLDGINLSKNAYFWCF